MKKKGHLYVKPKLFHESMEIPPSPILASLWIFLLQSVSHIYFINVCFSGGGFEKKYIENEHSNENK